MCRNHHDLLETTVIESLPLRQSFMLWYLTCFFAVRFTTMSLAFIEKPVSWQIKALPFTSISASLTADGPEDLQQWPPETARRSRGVVLSGENFGYEPGPKATGPEPSSFL